MKTYHKILIGLVFTGLMMAQNAYVQLIHTVADVVGVNSPMLDMVDIYISSDNGATWTLAVDNFRFRQATSFLPLPANNSQLKAGIAPGTLLTPAAYCCNTLSPRSPLTLTM